MRIRSTSTSILVAMLLSAAPLTSARAIDLGYAGRLAGEDGSPLAGPIDVTLRFFGSPNGIDQLGSSLPFSAVALTDGIFQLTISLSETQQYAIFGDGSRAVYVEVAAAGKVYPRQVFQAVPMALRVPIDNDTLIFSSDSSKLSIARVGMDQVTGLAEALDAKVDAVTASGASSGYLAAADWTRFDAKQPAITPATTLEAGSLATSQQGGLLINPFGAAASETGELRFAELSGGSYVGFKAPDALTSNRIWTLPAADGATGQFLTTDGSGVLAWGSPAGGGDVLASANLSDLSDAAAARGNLGLGPLATASAVASAQITDGSIVNADIAGTAQIATSKLSGAVTAIAGHGLGTLATLNAVTASEITDGAIANADISATAQIATSKLSGAVTSIAGHGLGALATLSEVNSAQIADGQIVDADLSASAAIGDGKLATISTAGKVSGAAITSGTIAGTATFSGSGGVSSSGAINGTGNFNVSGTGAATTELRFGDNDNSNYVGFRGPGTVAANNVWTLPATDGGSGQFLSTNGSGVLSWGSPAGGGDMMASANLADVANVATARTNLGLGSIATLSAISSADITDGAIANADISGTAQIATSKLSGAVTSITGHGLGALATLNGVGAAEINAASVGNSELVDGSVTSQKISDGSIATIDISADAVTGNEIADGSITNADVAAAAAIATSKLSGALTSVTGHGLGSLATLSAVGSAQITDGQIVDTDISGSAAIATSKLSGAITSVTGHGLGSLATLSAIASANITDGTITDADISGTAAISSTKISFVADSISGNTVDGGTISNFASTGIDDNASGVAMTLNPGGNVGIGTTTPAGLLDVNGKLTVLSGGNVGIGTTNPAALAHAYSDAVAIPNAATTGFRASGSDNGNPGYVGYVTSLDSNGVQVDGYFRSARTLATTYRGLEIGTATNHPVRIMTNGTADAAERMRIAADGNVGIGTTSPSTQLEVRGSVHASNGGYFVTKSPDSTTQTELFSVNGTNYFGSMTNHDLRLRTNDLDRMTILAGGNVGIGTTAPGNLLDVGSASQFSVNSTGNLTKVNNVAYSWPASQGGASTTLTNDGSGNLTWSSGGSSQWTTSASNIYYNSGNVGVGTSNPTAKLQVEGDIAATGTGKVLFGYSIQTYASAGTTQARAACPANSMILGGGCWPTGGGMAGRNYPSTENTDGTAAGTAVADGASAAYSWTCSASASGITAYAICGRVGP